MGRVTLRLVALLTVLLCLTGAVATNVAAASHQGKSAFHIDLYQPGDFTTQYRMTWCVGASSQMILNMIQGTTDTTRATQKTLVTYAMYHDGFPNSHTGGSDATGFAAALNHFGGGGTYHPVLSTNFHDAVHRAVKALERTGKPVGLLVMGGRHAWALSGFDATANPATTNNFDVTALYVEGPLYPRKLYKGYFDEPPDSRILYDDFRTPFHIFNDPDSPQFDGYWVTVNP